MKKTLYNSRIAWLKITKPELFTIEGERETTSSTPYVQEKEVTRITIKHHRNNSNRGLYSLLKVAAFSLSVAIISCFYVMETDTKSDHPPSQLKPDEMLDSLIQKSYASWKH